MGYNFHVERHFKFEVEIGVKSWSMPSSPVHRRRAKFQLGELFLQNP
jgi:hypothetical protein